MNFPTFQKVYAASDVRTVVVFSGAYTDIFPHIAVQGTVLDIPVEVYAGEDSHYAASMSSSTRTPQSQAMSMGSLQPNASAFITKFHQCLNSGSWLVVANMESIEYADWRTVSQRLTNVLPDSHHKNRAAFRLFGFLPDGGTLQRIAPPLLCQFALNVDRAGNITSRTDVSPIFKAESTISVGASGSAIEQQAGGLGSAVSKRTLSHGRTDPYATAFEVRARALGGGDRPIGPYDPEFVDEVLCSVREVMLLEQQALLRAKEEEEWAADGEEDEDEDGPDRMAQTQATASPASPAMGKDAKNENNDWIYHKMLAWVVEQCPDADISAIPEINSANLDISMDTVIWSTQKEVCELGSWCGSDVLVKRVQHSLVETYNIKSAKAFASEAAHHFALRHPQILQLYGMCEGKMVMEYGRGSLEQSLIQTRYDGKRWTLRKFLKVAQCVLRGLCYLENIAIHRDIACRSIIDTGEYDFKIGQFDCLIPLRHTQMDAARGKIPIRWSAPEALGCEFSPKSDVWSFGVMMWEAVQYATRVPYDQADEFAAPLILSGETLECPVECPDMLFEQIIHPCFVKDPEERPAAEDILLTVEKALGLWKPKFLDAIVPFPTGEESFSEFNKERLA